ncbi:hypothetical protein HPB50_022730 [Hyalomma asiaticum]|uniref:Uncharacterized protein n=1 Tax=Hyalomma asiaticum TaxID=266040 RepID=A0ACB7RL38_HYAAI|nr:hypothetical protein HPB50_022730 [Hyalomma asiaticum]
MAHGPATDSDIYDRDVNAFLRKGLEWYESIGIRQNCTCFIPGISKYGVELIYNESLSDADACLLRIILNGELPVRKLRLNHISLSAFRLAFHNQDHDKCPSLKEVHVDFIDCQGDTLDMSNCGVLEGLRSLHLGADNTEPAFAEDIASYILRNKSLTELSLRRSCGGDRGVATLAKTLRGNSTLKRFSLSDMELASDTLTIFAKVLERNSTLELVQLINVCAVRKDRVSTLLRQGLYARVFKRLNILWPAELLPELRQRLREQGCPPLFSAVVTPSAGVRAVASFFYTVAVAPMSLRELCLYPGEAMFPAFTDGLICVLNCATTLRHVAIRTCMRDDEEHHLISILDALRTNCYVTKFETEVAVLTPGIASSLSELLAVNNRLNQVALSANQKISPANIETIANGLERNYTLTALDLDCGCYDSDESGRIRYLLERNLYIENEAALFVISGVGVSYENGMYGLRLVHSSAGLVEKVQALTGKTREEALNDIQGALACLPA